MKCEDVVIIVIKIQACDIIYYLSVGINQSYRVMEVMAGGLAASAACVFTNPMEVVKNRSR